MERLTNLPSRSDLARLRELERLGLTQQWYDAQLQLQTVDDVPVCAECEKPESAKTKTWGHLRGLVVDQRSKDRLVCGKCASKFRSAKARTRIAEMEAKKEEEDRPKSFDEFWNANRAQLDPAELEKLRARHEEITFLYDVIVDYNDGTDGTTEADRLDTVAEVLQELRDNGTVDCQIVEIPFYLKEESGFYNQVLSRDVSGAPNHARATATFAKYGFLTALPIFIDFNQVRIFLQKFGPKPRASDVTVKCNQCGKATLKLLESEARARFGTLDNPYAINYRCEACQQKTDAAVKQFSERLRREVAETHIFDSYGRVKDFDRGM